MLRIVKINQEFMKYSSVIVLNHILVKLEGKLKQDSQSKIVSLHLRIWKNLLLVPFLFATVETYSSTYLSIIIYYKQETIGCIV